MGNKSSQVANSINNLPVGLENSIFDTLYLITPNRLKLGRNNNRSPIGTVTIVNECDKILEKNSKIFNNWLENWLVSYVPRLMHHPKWYYSDYQLNEGDIVLFFKQESVLLNTYQYVMVISTEKSKDGLIRKANLKYRNHNENVYQETFRSVRNLIMIHPIDSSVLYIL